MITIFSSNYLARKPIEKAMKKFAKNFDVNQKVLDIGCGKKPYAKYFFCKYIGLDPYKEINPDIVAKAWKIPVPDNSFDGIVLNQSLEHIEKTQETISEIKRVLKPGGLGIITAPQTMKVHSLPVPYNKFGIKYWHNDFYRFTKFGLINLFKNFEIISIKETNGYFGTIFQLINYFFASFGIKYLFIPVFLINNILGFTTDTFFYLISSPDIALFKKIRNLIYTTLTLNYILIIKK